MSKILESELILNSDGSVYHLNLKPENISDTIILVGDQDRVPKVARHFESIQFETQKREFRTITGTYKGLKLTVLSTGIGTDNIDIVLNELDALANINLKKRTINKDLKSLNFIRIGTSGSIQKDIPVDSFLMSKYSLGLDGLLQSYNMESIAETAIEDKFIEHTQYNTKNPRPYFVRASPDLANKFISDTIIEGFTITSPGFYGPQGRVLRLSIEDPELNSKMSSFNFKDTSITNFEMETSGIYGLSKLLGHKAISLNAIIANRSTGEISKDQDKTIDALIIYTLDKLVEN